LRPPAELVSGGRFYLSQFGVKESNAQLHLPDQENPMLKRSSRIIALFVLVFVSLAAVLFVINVPHTAQALLLPTQQAFFSNSLTINQDAGFDMLSPGYPQIAYAGRSVTFTHTLTNIGISSDTFMVFTFSANGWPIELYDATGPFTLPVELDQGLTKTILLQLNVPSDVLSGTVDTILITATSQTSLTLAAESIDTATVQTVIYYVYLPIIIKHWPPIPYTPVMNAIDNTDGDGDYVVSWNTADLADYYLLQESSAPTFSGSVPVYTGSNTDWSASSKSPGLRYYRVRATNTWGDSDWSDVRSVYVRPPNTFTSIADTDIFQGYPTANIGNDGAMWVGYDDYLNPDGKIVRSLIKFDVSAIPIGTPLNGAVLNVYLGGSWDYPGRTRTMTAYRIGSNWAELSVTWNTAPALSTAYGSTGVTHGAWGWYSFDVTALVRGWVNHTIPNYGVALRGPEGSGIDSSWKSFSTREGSYPPQLVITYDALPSANSQAFERAESQAGRPVWNSWLHASQIDSKTCAAEPVLLTQKCRAQQ
jgi:hypothetical protein